MAMMSRDETCAYRARAAAMLRGAGVVLTAAEEGAVEIADFGLGRFEREGLALLVYVNTERYCAKEVVMWPGQRCPERMRGIGGGTSIRRPNLGRSGPVRWLPAHRGMRGRATRVGGPRRKGVGHENSHPRAPGVRRCFDRLVVPGRGAGRGAV